jgi:uncharacterized membrane protein (UPF0127 family)
VARTGAELVSDLREARGVWGRFRGLMLAKRLPAGAGLDIRPCSSIHMMFMRFRIDAVFYDADRRVTKVARNVPTWVGISLGGKGAKGVIELPAGAASGVEAGDQLEFGDTQDLPGRA